MRPALAEASPRAAADVGVAAAGRALALAPAAGLLGRGGRPWPRSTGGRRSGTPSCRRRSRRSGPGRSSRRSRGCRRAGRSAVRRARTRRRSARPARRSGRCRWSMLPSIICRTKACSGVKNEQSRASSSRASLRRMTPRARSARVFGFRSPAMTASSMARPETPWMSLITPDSFRCASSSSFSAALLFRGPGLGQLAPVAGMGAQPPDVLRRHERAGQRPALGDPGQPDRVQLVALRPPGQRLDLRRLVEQAGRSPCCSSRK